jgi:hypothetical protein
MFLGHNKRKQFFNGQVTELIVELMDAGAAKMGVEPNAGYVERLCAYSRSVAHFPTAVKEFQWRNGWFTALSEEAVSFGRQDPCPTHTERIQQFLPKHVHA